jgi:hypothetical protein
MMRVVVAVSALLGACNAFSFKQVQVSVMEPVAISWAVMTVLWNNLKIYAFYALCLAPLWSLIAAISHDINHFQSIWCGVWLRHNVNVTVYRTPQSMIRWVWKNALAVICTEVTSYSVFRLQFLSFVLLRDNPQVPWECQPNSTTTSALSLTRK